MTPDSQPIDEKQDAALERLEVYSGMVNFLLHSRLPVDCRDEDELLSSIAAAYPPEYVRPIPILNRSEGNQRDGTRLMADGVPD